MFRCPVDDTTILLKSPKVGVVRFETEAFKFIADHPFVFIHCHIRICDAGNPNSRCAEGCVEGSRKRRDVSSDDKVYPLAQGPLRISSDATQLASKRQLKAKGKYVVALSSIFQLYETTTTINVSSNMSKDLFTIRVSSLVLSHRINP